MKNCENFIEKFDKKQKKKRRRNRLLIVFLCVFFIVFVVFLYYYFVVKTVVIEFSKSSINQMVTNSVNNVIGDLMKENDINFSSIVNIEKSGDNKVTSLSINSFVVNKISNQIATKTEDLLSEKSKFGILIPIGTLSGIYFLNGKGRGVEFSCMPIGEVECEYNSLFESTGINQTIHKLYIDVKSKVSVNLPIRNFVVENKISFLACETVIVGDVPMVYIKQ